MKRYWKCRDCGMTERKEPHLQLSDHMQRYHGKTWSEARGMYEHVSTANPEREAAIGMARHIAAGDCFQMPPGELLRWANAMAEIVAADHPVDENDPLDDEFLAAIFGPAWRVEMSAQRGRIICGNGFVAVETDDPYTSGVTILGIATKGRMRSFLKGMGVRCEV